MKMGRFSSNERVFYGRLEGDTVFELADIFNPEIQTEKRYALNSLTILSPCQPGKAVCVGLNYLDHIKEFGHDIPSSPVLFIKPSGTVIGCGDFIEYPRSSRRVDYEAELAVVIKKECRGVSASTAADYIFGYTCANDVTARDLQQKDGQWTRGKSFDTFLPLGPYIVTDIDPGKLDIRLYLNGAIKQNSSTSNLIFKVPELVAFISEIMTLFPGDVILTGTPSGVGPMCSGDLVEVEIQGLGRLSNRVRGATEIGA